MSHVRLATRASGQARAQAETVGRSLVAHDHTFELVLIETQGDRTQAAGVPLHSIGGQGVFAKEVQLAVLDGRADAAVHSAKDLPTEPMPGLTIGAFTARRSSADALIGRSLTQLDDGATVATGSVRRRSQLRSVRPDLRFVELRGNIEKRLDKIPDGGAIVMAVAALEVLGLTDRIAERLDPQRFVPAVGQGCVALECRGDDAVASAALAAIDHAATRSQVLVERSYLAELGSGCALPVGAHSDGARLTVYLAGEHDTVREQVALSGLSADDQAVAAKLARAHIAQVGPAG